MRVTNTVGAGFPEASKLKPVGAVNLIVPVPISPVEPSLITGPVKEVNVLPVVVAEIAEPPLAGVTVTLANTGVVKKRVITTARARAKNIVKNFLFISFYLLVDPGRQRSEPAGRLHFNVTFLSLNLMVAKAYKPKYKNNKEPDNKR